jgi:hypothetical protein
MMPTVIASILLTFVAKTNAEVGFAESQSRAEEVMARMGLGRKGPDEGIKATLSDKIASKLLPANFLRRGNMAPAQQASEKERALEQSGLKAKVAALKSEKLLTKLKKGKIMTKEELALKAEAAKKAFGEKLLASLIEEEKGLEAKVLAQKKKALEYAEILEQSMEKSKHPLSAAEKKEVREQIEKNALEYAHQAQKELAEAMAMEKKALGHSLSQSEIKVVEGLEMQAQKQLEASRVAMEEQLVSQKKKAFELAEALEENAAKAKHPLSAAEKKQLMEGIEANSLAYAKELQEEFEETKAMQKKAFGHPLSAVEMKHLEQFEAKNSVALLMGM